MIRSRLPNRRDLLADLGVLQFARGAAHFIINNYCNGNALASAANLSIRPTYN